MKKHRFHFPFRRKSYLGYRMNIYMILWFFVLLGATFLLIRFALITFSEEMGYEDRSFTDTVMYYLCDQAVENGFSLVGYTQATSQKKPVFTDVVFDSEFKIKDYLKEDYSLEAGIEKVTLKPVTNTLNNADGTDNFVTMGTAPDFFSGNDLSREYILTNGTFYNDKQAAYYVMNHKEGENNQLEVGSVYGDLEMIRTEQENAKDSDAIEASNPGNVIEYTMDQLKDVNFLIRNFYIVDPATKVTEGLFQADQLLNKDMKMERNGEKPQILIYHTHSQETYIDSREKEEKDSVIGVGTVLTQILEDNYGYQVIHDTSCYDIIDGVLNRNKAYNKAEEGISKILEENPSIEVVIDLHRDGAADKRTTELDGKETAQIMLFNGLSRDQNGPITYLENPYLQDNLALSLQLQLKAIELYPGLFYKNYLNCYRYNMHLRPKSLLIELGTDKNTVQSAKNAMEPFAKVLDAVLQGK